jgi:peptide deformylase
MPVARAWPPPSWASGCGCSPTTSTASSATSSTGPEGCLSFPGLRFDTPRALRVVARGWTMSGEPVTLDGTDVLARAVQHETDHLDGILFVDRLDPDERRQAMRVVRETDWGAAPPQVKVSPHAGSFGRR